MKIIRILPVIFFIGLFFSINKGFAQKDEPLIRFGLFADVQYADCESAGSRFYRNSLGKLKDCIDSLNNHQVQFTINLGDIIDRNLKDLDSVLIYLKCLDKKVYHTTGNHDYKGITDNKVLYEKLDMPSAYYFFKKKNWVFVFLNTNEISAYSNIKGTDKEHEFTAMKKQIKSTGGIQGANWNGGMSKEQLAWLNKLLAKCEKKRNNVLLFSHHPLYPKTEFVALNNMEILEVIDKYTCVKAIFSGHHHAGAFAYYKNIPVVTVEGMIETENRNSFGIVKIYRNKIVLEGKGRMTSRVFRWRHWKKL